MSSTVSSSFYRASLRDPPGAIPSTASPSTPTTTTPTTPQRPAPTRRFSSASVIAQITLLGYPPKIQPQSSATRDQGREQQQFLLQQSSPIIDHHESTAHTSRIPTTCSPLDALDEEAGCILIALANHDPTNNKKILPTTATTTKIMTADAVSTTSITSSSSTSTTSSDNGPSSTATKSSLETHHGNSMSISNLLGGSSSTNSDHAPELALKPPQHRFPEGSADSKNSSNDHVTWQKDDEDNDEENDPIMILAAAAAAVNDQDQGKGSLYDTYGYDHYEDSHNNSGNGSSRSKRKWHGYQYVAPDDYPPAVGSADIHRDKRHRYQPGSSAQESTWRQDDTDAGGSSNPSGNTKDAFSWQYLSMKQNPRIKRNAMHAYITYMIYTDMTQTQAVNTPKRQDTSKLGPVAGSTSNRPRDSAATAVVSPPPPAPTTSSPFSPPGLTTQQRGSGSYRFQMTAGIDEDYIYGTAGDRAPPHKSEIPQATAAKSGNNGSSTPYPTPSHTEITTPYPAENTTNTGSSAGGPTKVPSEWYHRHRSPYFSTGTGANTNDSTNRMASSAIVDRPLTAFLWDEPPKPMSGARQDGGIALPPLSTTPFPSSSPSPHV